MNTIHWQTGKQQERSFTYGVGKVLYEVVADVLVQLTNKPHASKINNKSVTGNMIYVGMSVLDIWCVTCLLRGFLQ